MAANPYITSYSQTYSEFGFRQSKMWPADTLCMTIAGANTAKVGILKFEACFPDSIVGFIPDKNEADIHFVMYSLGLMKEQFLAVSRGATQDNLGLSKLLSFPLLVPELNEQRKIAAILAAYEELIETNRRRIDILEKMAEEIYREWFVRMRFPGQEDTKLLKGVPEGWKVVELREVCSEVSKGASPGAHLSDRYYLPLDALATKQMLPTNHYDYTAAQSSLSLFEKGDILFGAMRPYQHKVVVAPFRGITRTTVFVIRPKEEYLHSYIYLTLFQDSSIDYATLICNGADRPYAVWNRAMARMNIFLPDAETLKKFETLVGPILSNIREYYFIQRRIAETRDLLLPRLISGKLSVADLDIQFPPSMREETDAHQQRE